MSYANNKGADQPAHPRSLISAFVVRCLDSVMSIVSVTKLSSLLLASVAEQASLNPTWSETPENMFSHDEAQLLVNTADRSSWYSGILMFLHLKDKGRVMVQYEDTTSIKELFSKDNILC